ncbi:hypothetical protein ACH4TV_24050 [Streptomyces sp. NPDC020898]|uniref:hypothetical protein n=1 Tax=Streptomyces sp. NPDC020898 TaxID=3365101 RepID=UPI0037B08F51
MSARSETGAGGVAVRRGIALVPGARPRTLPEPARDVRRVVANGVAPLVPGGGVRRVARHAGRMFQPAVPVGCNRLHPGSKCFFTPPGAAPSPP